MEKVKGKFLFPKALTPTPRRIDVSAAWVGAFNERRSIEDGQ